MSEWKKFEQLGQVTLERLGKRIESYLTETPEARLLKERRRRQKRFRSHINAYAVVNTALFLLFAIVVGTAIPAFALAIMWGIGLGFHGLAHKNWLDDRRQLLQNAEEALRLEGGEQAAWLLGPGRSSSSEKSSSATDPLLYRCEKAAEETKTRLEGMGIEENRAVEAVDLGLERVKDLVAQRIQVEQMLREANPAQLDGEMIRIRTKVRQAETPEMRAIYQTQLELMQARAEKIGALKSLNERILASVDSYLLALTNLRMDAVQLKVDHLTSPDPNHDVIRPLRQLDEQMAGIQAALQEVARLSR